MLYAKPTVGKQIRITVQHPSSYIYRTEDYDRYTYVGTVLPDTKWTPGSAFEMTGTEDPRVPLRRIELGTVINLEYIDGSPALEAQIAPLALEEQVWEVSGSKGNTYTVIKRNGKVTCTCPGFRFRNNCRHLDQLK